MSDATAVLDQIERLGVKVTANRDRLILEPGSIVPAALLAQVREHKPEILSILSEAKAEFRRQCYETTRIMQEQGWVLVWSDTVQDMIAFAQDDAAAARVPAGIVPYTRSELEKVASQGPDGLRLIHEAKKHGAKVTGRSKTKET